MSCKPLHFSYLARRLVISLAALSGATYLYAQVAKPIPGQQFGSPVHVATPSQPAYLAAADVNGDGLPDLIYIEQSATPTASTTHVLLNEGKGGFRQSAVLASAGASIVIGHLLGSEHVDIGWRTADSRLIAAAGNGDGTFQPAVPAPQQSTFPQVAAQPSTRLLADMNGDGIPDLVMEDTKGRIEVYAGNRDGSYSSSPIGGTLSMDDHAGDGGALIAAVDLNGDGRTDLITYTPMGISVELQRENGNFKLQGPYPAGTGDHTTFTTADFNHDGFLDVAMDTPGGVAILYGKASADEASFALSATPDPVPFEGAFTITATLTPPAGDPVPSGMVTFSIPQLGTAAPSQQTVTLVNGTASYAVPAVQPSTGGTGFLPGLDTLTASYSGDSNYALDPALTGTQQVSLGVTSVTLTPAPPLNALLSTYSYGQPVNGYVNFFPQDPTYPVTGTWSQLSNGVVVPGCANIPATTAGNCPYGYPQLLDTGSYNFVEAYNGDAINGPAQSAAYAFKVIPDVATSVTLTSSENPAFVGTPIVFTASITENYAMPTGSVTFMDGGTPLGSAQLSPTGTVTGTAVLTAANLAIGTHPITVVYAGNNDFSPVTSKVMNQVILPLPPPVTSLVTIRSSVNPSRLGQAVIFTAAVRGNGAGEGVIPSGPVTFLDGATPIGTAMLNGGVATISDSSLAVGTHPITATYGGQAGRGATPALLPGVSQILYQQVIIPVQTSFSLTVTPNPATVPAGETASFAVTVSPPADYTVTPVTLSCTDPLGESVCTFANPKIPEGGGTIAMMITTTAPHPCGDPAHPYGKAGGVQASCSGGIRPQYAKARSLGLAGPLMAGVFLLLPWRRRRHGRSLGMLLVMTGLLGLSGCAGNCTDLGTALRSYTVTVTGVSDATAAAGPPVTETVAVKLTVTPQ